MQSARLALLVFVTLTAVGACADPAPGPRIIPTNEEPPTSRPSATAAAPRTMPLGPGPDDLRQVDWLQASLPGEFCGIDGLVRLRDGEATGESTMWGQVHLGMWNEPEQTAYGDIDGDGQAEAAVAIGCDNGGGTASGQLGFGYVVIRSRDGELVSIGTITPRQEQPDSSHVTLLGDARIDRDQVVVTELWYRASDPTCCPSGQAQTTWHLQDGVLVAGESVPIS